MGLDKSDEGEKHEAAVVRHVETVGYMVSCNYSLTVKRVDRVSSFICPNLANFECGTSVDYPIVSQLCPYLLPYIIQQCNI